MSADPAHPNAPPRKAAIAFILVTLFIDVFSFGLIIPVLPHLIQDFYGGDQGQAALISGWLSSGYWALQFASLPLIGALSDRFGRRPILLVSNLSIGFDFIMMALAKSMPLLVLGRLINGLVSANFSTASAYIADVTPPEKRVQAFGLMGAAFGIGFVLGPALGGYLASVDQRLPFWIAAGMSLANFVYGYFVLPESLAPEHRTPVTAEKMNPFKSLQWLVSKRALLGLAIIVFLSNFAHVVYPSTFVMFADYRFHWNEKMVGYTLAAVGVLGVIVQAGLLRKALKLFGERNLVLIGLSFGVLGFAGYGLAPSPIWFWATMPVMALWGLAGPAVQSLCTQLVGPTEQGRVQGALNSLSSLANIFGPILFTHVFYAFIHPTAQFAEANSEPTVRFAAEIPGAAFLLASVVLLIALIVAYLVVARRVLK